MIREHAELEQGSDEWLEQRCGLVTASTVGNLLTATGKVADNDTARTYKIRLAAERITGHVERIYENDDMRRGHEEEPLARDVYARHRGVTVRETGIVIRDDWGFRIGYSPDGLIDADNGLLEIKSRRQKKHVQTVYTDRVPVENMAQLQCGLLVTGRDYIDYVSYSGGMRLYVKRVLPDPLWHAAIVEAVRIFEDDVAHIISAYEQRTEGMPLTERLPDPDEIW